MKPLTIAGVLTTCLLAMVCCVNCAVPAQPRKVFARVEATEGERFFQYLAHIKSLSLEALHRELVQQDVAFAQSHSVEDRLRLALLLSLPGTDFENSPYALELLQAYLNEPAQRHTRFMDIATLLVTFLQNQKQMKVYESLAQQLQKDLDKTELQLATQQQLSKKLQDQLDTQRSLHQSLSKQLQEALSEKERQLAMRQQLNKKLQDERKNVKRLQEKIEKIKDIEKSLIERERKDNKGT